MSIERTTVIQARTGLAWPDLRELWMYRDLFWILAGRDVRLRYRQTVLGVVWVVLQPLLSAVIFAIVFGRLAGLPSNGTPYLLFALTGLLGWNTLASILQRSAASVVGEGRIITKVYFPRVLIPLASAAAVLVDFAVTLAVVLVLMAIDGRAPSWSLLMLPVFLAQLLALACGAGLWLSALNVRYRDFAYVLPFMLQAWMYASPVSYSSELIPANWQVWYGLNPAAGLIEGFRWSLLGGDPVAPLSLVVSAVASLVVLLSGLLFFTTIERRFADVI